MLLFNSHMHRIPICTEDSPSSTTAQRSTPSKLTTQSDSNLCHAECHDICVCDCCCIRGWVFSADVLVFGLIIVLVFNLVFVIVIFLVLIFLVLISFLLFWSLLWSSQSSQSSAPLSSWSLTLKLLHHSFFALATCIFFPPSCSNFILRVTRG